MKFNANRAIPPPREPPPGTDVYKRQTLKPSAFDPAKKDGNLSAQIISQEQPVSETAALNPDWVEWLMGFPKRCV